ncbi:MAG TPA: SDR family NAD(P)-dependent oxidoreductase [Polyangiaceae bacterium]|nr:SDR family NAD(P)-dependent oxidoreductase [Polyangiaceae bacterium]
MTKPGWKSLGYAAAALTAALAGRSMLRRSRRTRLAGKKVLIVGGSRGLGFAAARRFLREGADVAICARYEAELARAAAELRGLAESIEDASGGHPRVVTLRADVTQAHAANALIESAIRQLGCVDVLVNCAVDITIGPLEALTAEDYEQAFRGIFFAVYHPTMAVLPHMKARSFGRIVNVTSVAGKAPIPHNGTYVTGKFATTGFSAVCAAELRKYGIRVSTVLPPPLRNGAWLNASYKGLADQELCWFARALQSPLTSADPERAARAIVEAARWGDVERMVTPTSFLQARLHALWPSLSVALAAFLDARWMPASPPGASALPAFSGEELVMASNHPTLRRISRAARSDAERYLQPIAAKLS